MNEACHEMNQGEVLNAEHKEYPLFHGLLYGDRVSTAKFSKRLSCSIKHLPVRVSFSYEYDTLKAVEDGDVNLSLEGDVSVDEIHAALAKSKVINK